MVKELNANNYDEALKSKNLVLIDFWAEFCNPCKKFKVTFSNLSQKADYQETVDFYTCDAEEQDDIADKFSVRSIPTLVFIKNGTVCGRITGAVGEEEVINKIKDCLNTVIE